MYEHKTVVDKEGYIVNQCVLFIDGTPQNFILTDGQNTVELCEQNLVKGKFVNGIWQETASDEEVEKYKKSIEW